MATKPGTDRATTTPTTRPTQVTTEEFTTEQLDQVTGGSDGGYNSLTGDGGESWIWLDKTGSSLP